jgi:hypothetical protein
MASHDVVTVFYPVLYSSTHNIQEQTIPYRLPNLAMLDTIVELATYIHHLIAQMDSNMGDWFNLISKLSLELWWMRIQQTGLSLVRFSKVKPNGASFEEFVKSNEEHMPVHNLLLRALAQVGIDTYAWAEMKGYMNQCCWASGSGGQHYDRQIGVSNAELPMVLKAFFKLHCIDEDSQGPLIQVVHALKDVRRKEPELTGWEFLGYPD